MSGTPNQFDYFFSILLVGAGGGVGKSSIIKRFVHNVFTFDNTPSIGVNPGFRTIELNGKKIKLLVWDTGGSERYDTITSIYLKQCSGVLVVYDVLDYDYYGLKQVKQRFLPLIKKHCTPDVVKMLIANKCDAQRAISTMAKEGRQLAIDHGMRFMEVSAKSGMNVDRAFVTIAREMLIVRCKLPVIHKQRDFLTCCEVGDFDSIAWEMLDKVCDPRTVATPFDRSTPLHYTCLNGNLSAMKLLVEKYKCDVVCKNYLGEMPLHWAVENGNTDIVKYMISGNYANPSDKNTSGQNALHVACKYGRIEIIEYLLSTITEGCIQQKDVFQKTALHWACESGCEEAIRLMVAYLDPNDEDENGQNCLHIIYNSNRHACPRRNKIVEYLISLPQCDVRRKDKNGRTCLHWASEEGQLDIVKYLTNERHCNPNDKNKDGQNCLHIAFKAGCLHVMKYLVNGRLCNPSDRTDHGHDFLQIACVYHRPEIIDYLVSEIHLDPTQRDASGQSCLQLAYCSEVHRDFMVHPRYETVKYLISLPQCNVDEKDASGGTCLHWACQEGLIDVVKYLVSERNCDPNVKNGQGENCQQVASRALCEANHFPSFKKEKRAEVIKYLSETESTSGRDVQRDWLHWACSRGYANLVKYFISDLHYNPNDKNLDGQNCFHVACRWGHTAIVVYLMSETKCNIQEKDKSQRSGLHLACAQGCFDTVKFLTRSLKCNINERDEEGQNCLHLAYTHTWVSLVETVKYLITIPQCVVDEQNKEGKTCLHWACQKGHLDIAKYLINERQCDPNDESSDNQNCLQIAFEHDRLAVVEYLLHNTECNILGSDKYGRTCLHWACEKGHLNLVMKLITEKNSNPSIKSRDGLNCLHIACRYGKANIVTYLLKETQVDVHEKDTYGRTCLHWACEKGNVDVVRILPIHESGLSQRDFSGKTPLQLAGKKEVLVELIQCVADPTDEHMNLLQPMSEPSISMFVVGNPSAGKTTLVEALTIESSGLKAFLSRFQNVSVAAQTAGIIPTEFESDIYGRVTFFDLAGQKQYYASHAAVLQKSISSAPPIILLVVKLHESEEKIKRNLLYWFHFLENQCKEDYSEASTRPHLFIIGSHADKPQALDEQTRTRLLQQLEIKPLKLVGFVELDCRKAQSAGISRLRQSLKTSCDVLRKDAKVEFRCHCLLVFLLDRFRERGAISLRELITAITELPQAETAQPHDFIPYSPTTLSGFCSELNARGHILFLKNETNIENSWIILNNEALLQQVLGTVFAPKEFKEHRKLASSTGVVPFSKLARHFADHDVGMLSQFLCHLEFCHEICDPEVLEIICKDYQANSSTNEQYFFFPSLVSVATPDQLQVWGNDSRYSYHCGWMLQCSNPEQFLTPRFLQVLLLRLAFFFALAPSDPTVHEAIPVLKRKCSVWKNGIHWLDDDGVSTLFEVDEQSQSLTVIMRCLEGSERECVCLRSNIIRKVLAALHEFSPRVPTLESFIHPCDVQYPLKPREQLTLFDVTDIATSVLKAKRAVVTDSQNTATIAELLYFEPFASFGKALLLELLNKENPDYDQEQVTDDFLYEIANKIEEKYECFKKMLNLPPASVQVSQGPPGPAHAMAHLLLCWKERSEGTRECLRSKMDEFSVFAGRNPLELAGRGTDTSTTIVAASNTSVTASSSATNHQSITMESTDVCSPAEYRGEAAVPRQESEPPSSSPLNTTTIEETDNSTLGIESLYDVNKEVVGVADWFHLGLSLGLEHSTQEKIEKKNHGDIDRCMTDMLAAWLQGQDKSAPSWRALVTGLTSHAVSKKDVAMKIAMAHGMNQERSQSCRELPYSDVDDSDLDDSSLYAVAEEVVVLSKHWFHLGLALHLSYHTLETIEADYPGDSRRCMTEMLTVWLKCEDMVNERGGPSWRALVLALDSPLVRKPEVANMVAAAHKKNDCLLTDHTCN